MTPVGAGTKRSGKLGRVEDRPGPGAKRASAPPRGPRQAARKRLLCQPALSPSRGPARGRRRRLRPATRCAGSQGEHRRRPGRRGAVPDGVEFVIDSAPSASSCARPIAKIERHHPPPAPAVSGTVLESSGPPVSHSKRGVVVGDTGVAGTPSTPSRHINGAAGSRLPGPARPDQSQWHHSSASQNARLQPSGIPMIFVVQLVAGFLAVTRSSRTWRLTVGSYRDVRHRYLSVAPLALPGTGCSASSVAEACREDGRGDGACAKFTIRSLAIGP